MTLNLHGKERVRVATDSENNFIDVDCLTFEGGLAIDLYPRFHYIEIRKKDGYLRIFLWKTKGHKHAASPEDIEGWEDAEVVLAVNDVNKDREKK
ncbi:MAG: hypothetical protein WC976_06200 [Caldisericia bacterium]